MCSSVSEIDLLVGSQTPLKHALVSSVVDMQHSAFTQSLHPTETKLLIIEGKQKLLIIEGVH
jgi:hypothetical protein